MDKSREELEKEYITTKRLYGNARNVDMSGRRHQTIVLRDADAPPVRIVV